MGSVERLDGGIAKFWLKGSHSEKLRFKMWAPRLAHPIYTCGWAVWKKASSWVVLRVWD